MHELQVRFRPCAGPRCLGQDSQPTCGPTTEGNMNIFTALVTPHCDLLIYLFLQSPGWITLAYLLNRMVNIMAENLGTSVENHELALLYTWHLAQSCP